VARHVALEIVEQVRHVAGMPIDEVLLVTVRADRHVVAEPD
jgi:hypothetical protein